MAAKEQVEPIKHEPVPKDRRILVDEIAAAELLTVSVKTLRKLPIPRRRLPGFDLIRYRREDLEEYSRSLLAC